jgi:hypothetical protein
METRSIDNGKVWFETLQSSYRLSIPTGGYEETTDTRETRLLYWNSDVMHHYIFEHLTICMDQLLVD